MFCNIFGKAKSYEYLHEFHNLKVFGPHVIHFALMGVCNRADTDSTKRDLSCSTNSIGVSFEHTRQWKG